MQQSLPDLGDWPVLEWEQWKDTAETLHMYTDCWQNSSGARAHSEPLVECSAVCDGARALDIGCARWKWSAARHRVRLSVS